MHRKVDTLIELLKDGEWHTIPELSLRTEISESHIKKLADFLANFSLLELSRPRGQKVRVRFAFLDFLKKVEIQESACHK